MLMIVRVFDGIVDVVSSETGSIESLRKLWTKKKKSAAGFAAHNRTDWAGTPRCLSGTRKVAAAITRAGQGAKA
jgi:hypothetical protein